MFFGLLLTLTTFLGSDLSTEQWLIAFICLWYLCIVIEYELHMHPVIDKTTFFEVTKVGNPR